MTDWMFDYSDVTKNISRYRIVIILLYSAVMLLERGIRDISRVLVLARNSVVSACSVEDAIPNFYKWRGTDHFTRIL